MPNTDNLTEQISVLRTETNPDGITPEALGRVLQAIVDFIAALGLIDISEEADLAARVTAAESAANAAETKATTALANASKNVIDSITATPAADKVTISVKQHGHSADTVDIPAATSSDAGVMSAADKEALTGAVEDVANFKPKQMSVSRSTTTITLTLKLTNNATLTVQFPAASTTAAGLMSKADKEKLDGLPAAASIALLDETGHLRWSMAPVMMLRNVAPTVFDDLASGDVYFDSDLLFYYASDQNIIELGTPSKNVTYVHVETNIQYRWTGSAFVPLQGDPKAGIPVQEVRCANRTQKRYDIPPGVLCVLKPSTDTVNFNLLSGSYGNADIHRIVLEASDKGDLVDGATTGLKWPNSLIWASNQLPSVQDIDGNAEAILVTIYNQRYADYSVLR